MPTVWRAIPGTTWRDRAPETVGDTFAGPDEEPCPTPLDRRWLWRLATHLLHTAPLGSPGAALYCDLLEYLRETCVHHWAEYTAEPEGAIEAHRQCLWCQHIEWTPDALDEVA